MSEATASVDPGNANPQPNDPAPQDPTPNDPPTLAAVDPTPDPAPVEPKWRDDWRSVLAGEDEKEAKRLERFKAPEDIYSSYRELEKKLSSGEYTKPLPKDANEEDVAKWRKDNGIPEKFDGYYEGLGDLVIGDEDKPIFDDFFESVIHKHNLPPEMAKEVAGWYYDLQKSEQDANFMQDNQQKKQVEDELREEWGSDYRVNVSMGLNLVDRLPESVRDLVKNTRLPGGQALLNNKDFWGWLVGIERQINPSSTLVPAGSDPLQATESRLDEIAKIRKTNPKEYYGNEKMLQEERSLIGAKMKWDKK